MLSILRLIICALIVVGCVLSSSADTRRVPQDYATIQAALDSLQDNDTVLVAVGTYAEALRAPGRSGWMLRGDVVPDTGNYPRPVVDPSTLPRPDTVTCLILDSLSSEITIEDFVFHNGREMYDSLPREYLGGVVNNSVDLTVRRCLFDSTYVGISGGTSLELENCRFDRNRLACAIIDFGPIHAIRCLFSCDGGAGYNVVARDHSTFRFCEFRDNTTGELLVVGGPTGDSTIIEDCLFGPYFSFWSPVVWYVRSGCVLRNSIFNEMVCGPSLIELRMDCANEDPLPLVISQCVIMNYVTGYSCQGAAAISSLCDEAEVSAFCGIIEDNVFQDGFSDSTMFQANGMDLEGRWIVSRNRLTRLDPPIRPDIQAYRINTGPFDTLTMRDNLIDAEGLAVGTYQARIDARWNWWGDSTGPYHPIRNPNGQGGEVGNGVDFDPWYTDTSFLYTPEPRIPLPQNISVDVYPNPFNASATVKLRVPKPGIFQIDLYNTLGRHVRSLWSGAVAEEKSVTVDGSALASGLYFVRVWQPIENRPVAMEKMILLK